MRKKILNGTLCNHKGNKIIIRIQNVEINNGTGKKIVLTRSISYGQKRTEEEACEIAKTWLEEHMKS